VHYHRAVPGQAPTTPAGGRLPAERVHPPGGRR
jgi:hypothetical protein